MAEYTLSLNQNEKVFFTELLEKSLDQFMIDNHEYYQGNRVLSEEQRKRYDLIKGLLNRIDLVRD